MKFYTLVPQSLLLFISSIINPLKGRFDNIAVDKLLKYVDVSTIKILINDYHSLEIVLPYMSIMYI